MQIITHCIHFTIQFFRRRQVSQECLRLFYSPLSKDDGGVTVRTTNNAKPKKRQNTEMHQHGFHLLTFPLCKCMSIDIFRLHGMSFSQMVHHGAPRTLMGPPLAAPWTPTLAAPDAGGTPWIWSTRPIGRFDRSPAPIGWPSLGRKSWSRAVNRGSGRGQQVSWGSRQHYI